MPASASCLAFLTSVGIIDREATGAKGLCERLSPVCPGVGDIAKHAHFTPNTHILPLCRHSLPLPGEKTDTPHNPPKGRGSRDEPVWPHATTT